MARRRLALVVSAAGAMLVALDGTVLMVIDLPCPIVTSMGFGGPDMTTLYVTTGWSPGVTRAEDETGPGGALLAFNTGIRGLPEPVFAVG